MRNSRKRMVRAAKPFAARVCRSVSEEHMAACASVAVTTYYNTVIPGKDGELVQAGDEVPASGDVTSKEDAKGEDGYRVHLAASLKSRGARSVLDCECPGQGHWWAVVAGGGGRQSSAAGSCAGRRE